MIPQISQISAKQKPHFAGRLCAVPTFEEELLLFWKANELKKERNQMYNVVCFRSKTHHQNIVKTSAVTSVTHNPPHPVLNHLSNPDSPPPLLSRPHPLAHKLPPLTVAILSMLGLIAFMLLVCLLSCLFNIHKRKEKNKKLMLLAQQAGKGDGEAFRQVAPLSKAGTTCSGSLGQNGRTVDSLVSCGKAKCPVLNLL